MPAWSVVPLAAPVALITVCQAVRRTGAGPANAVPSAVGAAMDARVCRDVRVGARRAQRRRRAVAVGGAAATQELIEIHRGAVLR
jgi:hypothetical protein